MESNKISQGELQQLAQLSEDNHKLIVNFGQIEYEIQLLNTQKQELVEELKKLKTKELQTFKQLEVRYGKVNINLESGEITPIS